MSGYLDSGARTQAEDYEEEDDDSEYQYQKYHLRFEQRLSGGARYQIGSYINDKDYRTKDSLDNTARIVTAKGRYTVERGQGESLTFDVSFKHREKRYRDTPSDEYDQVVFSPKITLSRKDVYEGYFSPGISNYDYIHSGEKDQHSIFMKAGAKRYFYSKRLVLQSSYRFESSTNRKAARKKSKHDGMLGGSFVPDLPHIYRITFSARAGQGDTKDSDERDDDLDYRYEKYAVRSEHRLHRLVKTTLRYEYFGKDYYMSDLDHSGFRIAATWRQGVIADRKRDLYLVLSARHKEVSYSVKPERDYRKEGLEIQGVITRKRRWTTSLSASGDFYGYRDWMRDKNRYYLLLSLQRYFFKRRLDLSCALKYKYTDNRHANNTEEQSGRLAFRYRF